MSASRPVVSSTHISSPFSPRISPSTSSSESSGIYPSRVFSIFTTDGQLLCQDEMCDVTTNQKAFQIYQTIKAVSRFFLTRLGMDGIDRKGGMAPIYIGWDQNNAAWECSATVRGKECAWKFNDIYIDQPEVVAHEYTHAIVSSIAGLTYANQSGALDESMADVFGITFKHWLTKNSDNWTIAGRNLAQHPETFAPHTDRPTLANDYGGVHQNSLIPSHAYYIAVQLSGQELLIANIWFKALKMTKPDETFMGFARKTVVASVDLSSSSSQLRKLINIINASWHHVGIDLIPSLRSKQPVANT